MTTEWTEELVGRVQRDYERIAKELIRVEVIGSVVYAFGSELAVSRLQRKLGSGRAAWSINRDTWYFAFDTDSVWRRGAALEARADCELSNAITVVCPRNPSVGMNAVTVTVQFHGFEVEASDEREQVREVLAKAFGAIVDNGGVTVMFADEYSPSTDGEQVTKTVRHVALMQRM